MQSGVDDMCFSSVKAGAKENAHGWRAESAQIRGRTQTQLELSDGRIMARRRSAAMKILRHLGARSRGAASPGSRL